MTIPEERTALSDRQLLLNLCSDVAVVKDRTEELPEFYERVTRVETDMSWMKKAVYGVVPTTGAILGSILAWFGLTD